MRMTRLFRVIGGWLLVAIVGVALWLSAWQCVATTIEAVIAHIRSREPRIEEWDGMVTGAFRAVELSTGLPVAVIVLVCAVCAFLEARGIPVSKAGVLSIIIALTLIVVFVSVEAVLWPATPA